MKNNTGTHVVLEILKNFLKLKKNELKTTRNQKIKKIPA